jgi:anti-anti-sigma factor
MTRFAIHVDRRGDIAVLRVSGEFDLTSRRDFEARAREALDGRVRALLVDLRRVSFVDSTGISQVLELWSRARREGWEFAVVRPPDRVHQTFLTAGLNALPVVESLPGEDRAA